MKEIFNELPMKKILTIAAIYNVLMIILTLIVIGS